MQIRNAGGRASDDAIRSLVISHKLLGTSEFFVIHHTDCGMEFVTGDRIGKLLEDDLSTAVFDGKTFQNRKEAGGSPEGHYVNWLTIADQHASIKEDVLRIVGHPLVNKSLPVHGYLYNLVSQCLACRHCGGARSVSACAARHNAMALSCSGTDWCRYPVCALLIAISSDVQATGQLEHVISAGGTAGGGHRLSSGAPEWASMAAAHSHSSHEATLKVGAPDGLVAAGTGGAAATASEAVGGIAAVAGVGGPSNEEPDVLWGPDGTLWCPAEAEAVAAAALHDHEPQDGAACACCHDSPAAGGAGADRSPTPHGRVSVPTVMAVPPSGEEERDESPSPRPMRPHALSLVGGRGLGLAVGAAVHDDAESSGSEGGPENDLGDA